MCCSTNTLRTNESALLLMGGVKMFAFFEMMLLMVSSTVCSGEHCTVLMMDVAITGCRCTRVVKALGT